MRGNVSLGHLVGTSAATTVMAVAAYYVYTRATKRRREEAAPPADAFEAAGATPPAESAFSLLSSIAQTDEFNELIRWMPAEDSVRVSRCTRELNEKILDPTTAAWCAESRRALLEKRRCAGDLPLAMGEVIWTLERLHLCENPPRFPRIYFQFASDELDVTSKHKIRQVATLLKRHPKLRLKICGFAQPEAPSVIGECLAQARAVSVRAQLLKLVGETAAFSHEDPCDGLRAHRGHPWSNYPEGATKLVGSKLQAIGQWRHTPRNRNFELLQPADGDGDSDGDDDNDDDGPSSSGEEVDHAAGGEDDGYESDDEGSKLRRAEFTLLGLDDE